MDLFEGLKATAKPIFRELVISRGQGSDTLPPVNCIIADGIMSFTIDIANEVGIPIISFRTISACSFWAYFSALKLIESGELPLKGMLSRLNSTKSSVHYNSFIFLFSSFTI